MTRLFGTDGVRGIANKKLTPKLCYDIGRAAAYVLAKGKKGKGKAAEPAAAPAPAAPAAEEKPAARPAARTSEADLDIMVED